MIPVNKEPFNPASFYHSPQPSSSGKGVTTATFFWLLHEKNVEHRANIRGLVNYQYNQLLRQEGLNEEIPGGEDYERLGMDQTTAISHPDLYYQAYQKILANFNDYALPPEISQLTPIKVESKPEASSPAIHIELQKFDKYNALMQENELDGDRDLIIPSRRVCGFGFQCKSEKAERAKKSVFFTESEIIKVHPMRFLRHSPFVKPMDPRVRLTYEMFDDPNHDLWKNLFEQLPKKLYGIGRTECGKHVILQQAIASCVPSCVGMLVLDHGKIPDYDSIQTTHYANTESAPKLVEEAGLTPILTELKGNAEEVVII